LIGSIRPKISNGAPRRNKKRRKATRFGSYPRALSPVLSSQQNRRVCVAASLSIIYSKYRRVTERLKSAAGKRCKRQELKTCSAAPSRSKTRLRRLLSLSHQTRDTRCSSFTGFQRAVTTSVFYEKICTSAGEYLLKKRLVSRRVLWLLQPRTSIPRSSFFQPPQPKNHQLHNFPQRLILDSSDLISRMGVFFLD